MDTIDSSTKALTKLPACGSHATSVPFRPDGKLLLSASMQRRPNVADAAAWQPLAESAVRERKVDVLCLSSAARSVSRP